MEYYLNRVYVALYKYAILFLSKSKTFEISEFEFAVSFGFSFNFNRAFYRTFQQKSFIYRKKFN